MINNNTVETRFIASNILRRNKSRLHVYLAIIMLTWQSAFALSTDSSKPVEIKADGAECQQKDLSCTYIGNVEFKQGSSFLGAPKISIYRNKENKIEKVIAAGNPASFHTMLDHGIFNPKPELLDARGNTIEIYPVKGLVVLIGNALVVSGQNRFGGEHIEYDVKKQTIVSQPSPKSRTTIVIEPQEQMQ